MLKQLTPAYEPVHPLGSAIINDEIYVDEGLSGVDSLEEAFCKQQDIIKLLSKGGLPLHKWSSSSCKLVDWLSLHF